MDNALAQKFHKFSNNSDTLLRNKRKETKKQIGASTAVETGVVRADVHARDGAPLFPPDETISQPVNRSVIRQRTITAIHLVISPDTCKTSCYERSSPRSNVSNDNYNWPHLVIRKIVSFPKTRSNSMQNGLYYPCTIYRSLRSDSSMNCSSYRDGFQLKKNKSVQAGGIKNGKMVIATFNENCRLIGSLLGDCNFSRERCLVYKEQIRF